MDDEPRECGLCGRATLTRNPHPLAGKLYLNADGEPTQAGPYVTAVGAVWECIPCLLQNVHRRSQREWAQNARVAALEAALLAQANVASEALSAITFWQRDSKPPEVTLALLSEYVAAEGYVAAIAIVRALREGLLNDVG